MGIDASGSLIHTHIHSPPFVTETTLSNSCYNEPLSTWTAAQGNELAPTCQRDRAQQSDTCHLGKITYSSKDPKAMTWNGEDFRLHPNLALKPLSKFLCVLCPTSRCKDRPRDPRDVGTWPKAPNSDFQTSFIEIHWLTQWGSLKHKPILLLKG